MNSQIPEARDAVFIVDDDEAVRDSVQVLLAARGFDALAFDSAAAILASLETRRPVCLIVDLHMPAINGIELLKTLIVRGIRLPAVMITGRIDRTSRRWAQEAGAAIVLEKPFTDDELFEAIRAARLVAEAGAEAAIRRIPNCPFPMASR